MTSWGRSSRILLRSRELSRLRNRARTPRWDNFWVGSRPHSPSSEHIIILLSFSMTNLLALIYCEKILPQDGTNGKWFAGKIWKIIVTK